MTDSVLPPQGLMKALGLVVVVLSASAAEASSPAVSGPPQLWRDARLPADTRAAALVDAMTLEEQISLLRPLSAISLAGLGADLPPQLTAPIPSGAIGSAAYVPGVPRLGWPALQESDAGLGVGNWGGLVRPGDEATAFPSSLALAASFDPQLAYATGAMLGAEAHAKGFNVQLAGGVNLARDPRNGRNFEYVGEDPLLAGLIVGASIAGVQSRHVVSTVKHLALNSQETGRTVLDARIDEAGLRESDLLAFEIAIETGRPGAVMCAYNKVNGVYACESAFLINRVLKGDWGFRGWVMSDWAAAHSLEASVRAGLDQQSPQRPAEDWFAGLAKAVNDGAIEREKVRDMALRVVRAVITVGALDYRASPGGSIDKQAHMALAQRTAEAGIVLLKNDGVLPLASSTKRVVLIGGHADRWVLTGGGSSQVNPWGGLQHDGRGADAMATVMMPGYIPSSPMKALQALRPDLRVTFDDGSDPARAAAAAALADVAIVFVEKPQAEGIDSPDLSLPAGQDALITTVAQANPRTVVVLETGNPVVMPWLRDIGAVLEVWYPGQRGGEAIAAILSGETAPSGRLPISFPKGVEQLPRPQLDGGNAVGVVGDGAKPPPAFAVDYAEGSDIGYRWFARKGIVPQFPFGFGLTYTQFRYSQLDLTAGTTLSARFSVTNVGDRAGVETAQLYLQSAPDRQQQRLLGWAKVFLQPGETRQVVIAADPRLLASWDKHQAAWRVTGGRYKVFAGAHAGDRALLGEVVLQPSTRGY